MIENTKRTLYGSIVFMIQSPTTFVRLCKILFKNIFPLASSGILIKSMQDRNMIAQLNLLNGLKYHLIQILLFINFQSFSISIRPRIPPTISVTTQRRRLFVQQNTIDFPVERRLVYSFLAPTSKLNVNLWLSTGNIQFTHPSRTNNCFVETFYILQD